MKVRTIKDVNIRAGSPSMSSPKKGVLYPGFELDVEPVEGEVREGINQWYRDQNGDFIWGGGVLEVTDVFEATAADDYDPSKWRFPPEQIDWRKRVLNLDESWTASGGEGVKIAVLDSGLDFDHPALKHVNAYNTFTFANLPIKDDHPESHGTHCAGIIAARRIPQRGVIGVAPNATLVIGRVQEQKHGINANALITGIDWAIGQCVQVISISTGLVDDISDLKAAILRAAEKKIVVVAAVGNQDRIKDNPLCYPAHYEACISVGAVDQSHVNANRHYKYIDRLDYVMPFQYMWSCVRCSQKYFDKLNGSSMSTALMSGIVALSLNRLKIVTDRPDDYLTLVRNDINTITIPMNEANDIDSEVLSIMKPNYSGG